MRNPHFYFTARRFFVASGGTLFRLLSGVALRSVRYEVADEEELRRIASEKQTIFYISNRSSLIEQFLLNAFFIARGIRVPSHSFGPRTLLFFRFGELLRLFIEWLKGGRARRYAQKITGLYLPVEDQDFFARDPGWADFIAKVPSREIRVVPVTTLWNKEVVEKSRKEESWLIPFIGTYHLWPTFRELLLFLLGRRRLALRIGLAHTIVRERYTRHIYRKFYALLKEEKKNIVGASLRNWLEIRNETLFDLDFGYEADRETAEKCLNEIATRYSPYFTDGVSRVIGRLLSSVFPRIVHRPEETRYLRRLAAIRNITLVFVPSHRSYFDYLIMFNLLYREQVAVPLVVAGDNLNFFPLGGVLRRLGAFFIRRRVRDDRLYKEVFGAYLRKIVESGYHIEFFIEGGRTRSGKVRAPRTGVLSMLADIKKRSGRRIYIVPVSITYEKLREVQQYQAEVSRAKEPERQGFLRKALGLFRTSSGPAYVSFGTPLYLPGVITDDFPLEVAYRIERGGHVGFSGLFASFFATGDELFAPALARRLEHLAALLAKSGRYQLAPALQHADLNVPRLVEKLRGSGQIVESSRREHCYRLRDDARHEFAYYRNTAAFALAPLFLLLFDAPEEVRDASRRYLEAVIQGYRVGDRLDDVLSPADADPWVQSMLCRVFLPSFELLESAIAFFRGNKLHFESRTDAVHHLARLFARRRMVFSPDELYDVLTYLGERGVIDNLFAFVPGTGENVAAETETIMEALKRAGVVTP